MSRRSELAAFLPGAPAPRARRRRGELTPEGAALIQIKDALDALCIPYWRTGAGAFPVGDRFVRIGTPGMPDLIALVPGKGAVFIEVKAPRGRLSPEQVRFRQACKAAGVAHVVARDVDAVLPWVRR